MCQIVNSDFKLMIKYIIISIFCLIPMTCKAQNITDAEIFFNSGNYIEAYKIYAKIAETNNSGLARYRVARCLMEMKRYDEAIPLLEYAAGKKVNRAYLYLYIAYYQTYQFDKALGAIDTYIELENATQTDLLPLNKKRQKALVAMNMFDRIEDITVTDSLKVNKSQFLTGYGLSVEMGNLKVTSTPDDSLQTVMFRTGRGDKKIFSKMSPQKHTDIYVSYKLIDGWSEENTISSVINSHGFNENYPFEMADGITLYFSADNDESLGGYDIFMSRYNTENHEYTKPVNIGMPFNSPANDYMLVIDEIKDRGWFATDRYQHEDTVVIYEFVPNKEKRLIYIEDVEIRRNFAAFNTYKTIKNTKVIDAAQRKVHNHNKSESIEFLLNDGLIYTDIDDFKSEEAKNYFIKSEDIKNEMNDKKQQLETKRLEYSTVSEEVQKQNIAQEIIILEAEINRLTKSYNQYIFKVRQSELNFFNNKQNT